MKICPVHRIECHLASCDETDTCKYVNHVSAIDPEGDPRSLTSQGPPDGVLCERSGPLPCNRNDCGEAGYCRTGYVNRFKSGLSLTRVEHIGKAKEGATWVNQPLPLPSRPACHTGWNYIGTIGKAHICLGRRADLRSSLLYPDRAPAILALDLSDLGHIPAIGENLVRVSPAAREFWGPLGLVWDTIPTIEIAWPDYGVPDLPRGWWDELVSRLAQHPGGDVAIYCMGGHGRTGTAAAILAVLGGFLPADEPCPVTWLRRVYCSEVVESEEQVEYIERITGHSVTATPRHGYLFSQAGYEEGLELGSYKGGPHKSAKESSKAWAEPTLSNNRYKRLVREMGREGVALTPFNALEDAEELEWGEWLFQWDAVKRKWEFTGLVGDAGLEETSDPTPASSPAALSPGELEAQASAILADGERKWEAETPRFTGVDYLRARLKVIAEFPEKADLFPRLGELAHEQRCRYEGNVFQWQGPTRTWTYLRKALVDASHPLYVFPT